MPVTNFFWEPLSDNILQERDEFGALTAEYTTEPGLYGNVISQSRSGVESQFHFDAVGSSLAVTNDNQQVTDIRAYAAFGETTESTGSTDFPFQFMGRKEYYNFSVTGQYAARRTPYEPALQRWLQPSTVGRTGVNPFVYFGNKPARPDDSPGYGWQHAGTIEAPSDPSKCKIALDCNQIASGPYHCGVIMSYYSRTGAVVVDRLHALGIFNPRGRAFGCHVVINPPGLIGTFYTRDVTEHPWYVCACILATAAFANAKIGTNNYRAAPINDACSRRTECNSNYIAKCLLRNCGVSKKQPDPAPGETHRMWRCRFSVVPKEDTPLGCFCCKCLDWRPVDTTWCGLAEQEPAAVMCRPATVYPKSHP